MVGMPSYPDAFAETKPEAAQYLKDMSFHTWYNVRNVFSSEEHEKVYFASSLQGHGLCQQSIRNFQKCFDADPRARDRWSMGDLGLCAREQFFAWTCIAKWTSLYLKDCEREYYDVAKFRDKHNVSPTFLKMKNCVYNSIGEQGTYILLFGDMEEIHYNDEENDFSFFRNFRKRMEGWTTKQNIPRIRQTYTNEDEPTDDTYEIQELTTPRFREGVGNVHVVAEGYTHTRYRPKSADAPSPQGPGAADEKMKRLYTFGPRGRPDPPK